MNLLKIFFAVLLVSDLSFASESGVVKAKKGNRLLIEGTEPFSANLGDTVTVGSEGGLDELDLDSDGGGKRKLRPRHHNLSWRAVSANVEVKVGNTTSSTQSTETEFSYLYNFGRGGIGFGMVGNKSGEGSSTSEVSTLALRGRLNFIENKPGSDLIPYLGLSLVSYREAAGTLTLDGTGMSLGVGMDWYPLSEIFALSVGLSLIENYDLKLASTDVKLKATGISVGWVFSF